MYTKLNIISQYQNRVNINFKLLLLETFFDEKRWIHANPTLYSTGEHKNEYKRYYVEDKDFNEKFFKAMLDDKKFVILQGKRGSGKTSFLNFFLNSKTRELNDKDLTWVRIDTTKLYKNRYSFAKNIDFETYLYGQLLFVYFRYKGSGDTCETRFLCPKETFSISSCDTVFKSIDLEDLIKSKSDELKKMYKDAQENALDTKHYNNSYDGKCFDCNELGKILYDAIAERLIIFIDGIDNINYNSNIKHGVWDDLKNFLNSIKDTKPMVHKIVITMRTENYTLLSSELSYLNVEQLRLQNSSEEVIPHFFDLQPAKLEKIINKFEQSILDSKISSFTEEDYTEALREILKKYQNNLSTMIKNVKSDISLQEHMEANKIIDKDIDALTREELEDEFGKGVLFFDTSLAIEIKKIGHSFSKKLEKMLHFLLEEEKECAQNNSNIQIKDQILTNYFKYGREFEKLLQDSIKERINWSEFDTVSDLFNGDLRELFILSYRSYAYLMDFAISRDEQLHHYSDIASYMRGRVLIIIRAVFQNGNRYRGGREDIIFYPPYRNINFINLFNILDNKNQSTPPLASLYLLKYLYSGSRTVNEIKKIYQDSGIDKLPIDKILNELLEFGYVDVLQADNTQELHYKATTKGRLILEYSLTNLDVIQSYIYGGLIDEQHKILYRIWHYENYASQILFNMLLIWHELEIQEKSLQELKTNLKIDFEIIPNKAKESFEKLTESFPGHHLISNINNYTKENKSLARELRELYHRIIFKGSHFDELYEQNADALGKILDQSERIIYATAYLNNTPEDILQSVKLHHFVFGNVELLKEQERRKEILKILDDKSYWDKRYELITKLSNIKKLGIHHYSKGSQ